MRTLEINGQEFNSLQGFYKSLESYLLEGKCPWGQNLDSLDEIVRYNFNYTDIKEKNVNVIQWTNFQKSYSEIREMRGNRAVIDIIEDIYNSNETIEFIKKPAPNKM
jgi:RNAse (barnase) inhibitor barstar